MRVVGWGVLQKLFVGVVSCKLYESFEYYLSKGGISRGDEMK